MPGATPKQKVVWAVSTEGGGGLMLLVGVSPDAWEYMRDGKTHHFDLAQIGLPIKLMMFGAKSRQDAVATIEEHNKRQGLATLHDRRDFSIKPNKG